MVNNRKIIITGLLITIVTLSGCMSAPTATDMTENNTSNDTANLVHGEDYEVYKSNNWTETVNIVKEKSDSYEYILDLGTRTTDGSMHILVSATAPQSNYEMKINNITRESRNDEVGLSIDASVVKMPGNTVGATVITQQSSKIEMMNITATDLDFVEAEITDGWNQTKVLEREACGCVLETDPRPKTSE